MSHRIIEIQPWDNRRTEIATAENYANAYTIAKVMSEKFPEVTYEAVNGNIERTITYKGGKLVSEVMEGREISARYWCQEHYMAHDTEAEHTALVDVAASSQAGLQAHINRVGRTGNPAERRNDEFARLDNYTEAS